MSNVRRRRWSVVLLIWLALAVLFGAIQQSVHGLIGDDRWNWAEMAAYGGAVGAVYPFAWAFGDKLGRRWVERGWLPRSRTRQAEDHREALLAPALKAGQLPEDADSEVWRPALRAEARQLHLLRWGSSGWMLLIAAMVGAAAIVANDNAWGVWLVAFVVLAEGVPVGALFQPRLELVRRLQNQLGARVEASGRR